MFGKSSFFEILDLLVLKTFHILSFFFVNNYEIVLHLMHGGPHAMGPMGTQNNFFTH